MKAVEVQISLDLLRQWLRLPETVKFTKVSQSYQDLHDGRFSLIVEGEDLPPIREGNSIPWGRVTLYTEWCNNEERTHITRGEIHPA